MDRLHTFSICLALVATSACASDSKPGLSSAESTAVGLQLTLAAETAANSIHPVTSLVKAATASASADQTTPCAGGGSLHVFGDGTGTLDDSGFGMINVGLTETITDCTMMAGNGQVVANGAPDLTANALLSFSNFALSSGEIDFGGGFDFTSANGGGTCNVLISIVLPSTTLPTGTVTGNICGQALNVQF